MKATDQKLPVLSLCDYTGVMVQPWPDAGHDAVIVDVQHREGSRMTGWSDHYEPSGRGMLTRLGMDVRDWQEQGTEWAAVFAFPPCTHLAKSGARWWKDKGLTALIEALQVVDACRQICEASGAPYMIENPSGALSTHWRKPDYAFDRGRPSRARITDAIAICDSMKMHKLTDAEQKLYWTGSAWIQQP